ncbi:MAG TPA: hypothetical protein VHD90_19100 [Phototrophicaceae bacterium]|nr:hypothetical protein [Phototrophicaceae bacterium]
MAAYLTAWLVENKVILFRVNGKYDQAVMRDGMIELDAKLAQAETPIYLINDMSELTNFAKNFTEMIGEMSQRNHFNKIVWTVTVTPSPLIRFFGNVATNMFGVKSRSVITFAEAIDVLLRIDPALEQAGLNKVDLSSSTSADDS